MCCVFRLVLEIKKPSITRVRALEKGGWVKFVKKYQNLHFNGSRPYFGVTMNFRQTLFESTGTHVMQ